MPSVAAHHEQRLRGRAVVLEDERDRRVAVAGDAPAGPRELALLEVADRVGGVQPVALEERAQERLVGRRRGRRSRRAGRSATVAISRDRGRRPSASVGGGAVGPGGRASPASAAQRACAAAVAAREARRSNGPRTTPSSVTIPVMSSAGVTSKAGLRTSVPGGAMRTPRNSRTSSARALLDRRWPPRRASRGRPSVVGAHDVERDAVARRQHGQRVGADLVGRVAVGRDPVRPDEDDVDLAAGHQVPGGHVGDQRVRDAGLGELPGRQPGALEDTAASRRPRRGPAGRRGGRPGRCPARSRTGRRPAVRCCSGSGCGPAGPRARAGSSRPKPAIRPWSVVASKTIASASSRIASAIAPPSSDRSPISLVAGHHPVDRPAQVDRGRPGVDEGVGAAAERRPPGVRPRRRGLRSALIASPIAATWPMAGAPRTIISRIA